MNADGTPRKLTALHYCHLAAGAQMVDEDGWQRPERYASVEEEVAAAREQVGIADISPNGKLDLKGGAVAAFAAAALRWPVLGGADLPVGARPGGSPAPRELPAVNTGVGELAVDGRTIAVRCCRLTADHLLLIVPPEDAAPSREALSAAAAGQERVHLTDVTSVLAGIALLGPRSRDVLRKLMVLDVALSALPDDACAETAIAGVHALLLRADMGGRSSQQVEERSQEAEGRSEGAGGRSQGSPLPAYELYVTRDIAEFVWDAVVDAGREFGIAPVGVTAYRSLVSFPISLSPTIPLSP